MSHDVDIGDNDADTSGLGSIGSSWRARHLMSMNLQQRLTADLNWTPEQLLAGCTEYFKWVADNPIIEERVNVFKGDVTRYRIPRVRAMTQRGLALYLGVSSRMWHDWAHTAREDLRPVVEWALDVIWTQKFEAAAAEQLNSGIIARELGLADKSELTSPDGSAKMIVQYQLPDNGRD